MRKLLTVILIAILISCGSKEKNVSLLIYNEHDPFIKNMTEDIRKETSNLYSLNIIDSENFQITQNENIDKRIEAGDDLLIINPVDRLGTYPIIKKLKSKDIPVIFFNREPLEKDMKLWDKAFYVGTIGEQSAEIQAEMVRELFGDDPENLNKYDRNNNGKIEVVILKGEQGHQDAEIRTSEFIKSMKRAGFKLNILSTEVADWNSLKAYELMKDVLKINPTEIELVLSNNDAMALGAISAMRQSGLFRDDNNNGKIDKDDEKWVPVIGIDGLQAAVKQIEEGYLYGTVLNDSKLQAQAIKELSDCILNNRDFSTMSFELIDDHYIMVDYQILQ